MTKKEKLSKCNEYFKELSEKISETYSVVESCNKSEYDITAYLVPNGTENEITYHSKPAFSFRISDHWNWYSNLKKNPNPHYIQCYSVDLPRAKKREDPTKASVPIQAAQVGYFDKDNKYHAVFGEIFDRTTKTWSWLFADPADVIAGLGLI